MDQKYGTFDAYPASSFVSERNRRFSHDTKTIYVTFTCRQWSKFLRRKLFGELMFADRGKKTDGSDGVGDIRALTI